LRIEISATRLGDVIFESFTKSRSKGIGEVVASSQNSFYVRTNEGELNFFTNRQLGSPVTVNLASNLNFEELVPPNSGVTLRESKILIGDDVTIRFDTAKPYRESIDPPASKLSVSHNTLHVVASILGMLDVNLSVLDANGIAHDRCRRFVRAIAVPLRESSNQGQFVSNAPDLLGLGTGFTPSGDDLLGGFLATWNSLAEMVGRSKILLDFEILRRRTNWISAKLLDYMQRELLDSQVSQAIQSSFMDGEDFVLAVETLFSRGHTSGLDLSTGILLAISLILDIENNTKSTEAFLMRMGL